MEEIEDAKMTARENINRETYTLNMKKINTKKSKYRFTQSCENRVSNNSKNDFLKLNYKK